MVKLAGSIEDTIRYSLIEQLRLLSFEINKNLFIKKLFQQIRSRSAYDDESHPAATALIGRSQVFRSVESFLNFC